MIIGASAVGKSCIFLNATQENYVVQETVQATIAVTKPVVKPCKLEDGSQMKLKVWDCDSGLDRLLENVILLGRVEENARLADSACANNHHIFSGRHLCFRPFRSRVS